MKEKEFIDVLLDKISGLANADRELIRICKLSHERHVYHAMVMVEFSNTIYDAIYNSDNRYMTISVYARTDCRCVNV